MVEERGLAVGEVEVEGVDKAAGEAAFSVVIAAVTAVTATVVEAAVAAMDADRKPCTL